MLSDLTFGSSRSALPKLLLTTMLHKLVNKIKFVFGYYPFHPITLCILAIILTHIPILVEPYWYWDSGFYQVIGQGMVDGKLLYVDIWDNKLPGIYFIFALFYKLFGHEQAFLHAFLIIWLCATAGVVYKLAKSFFNRTVGIISAWVFAFLVVPPVCTGGIPNAEIFMILPVAVAFYTLFKDTKNIGWVKLFVAGLLLGIGFLTKMVAVFELVAVFGVLTALAIRRKQYSIILYMPIIAIAFALPSAVIAIYYVCIGHLNDFLNANFGHNSTYVGEGNLTLWLRLLFTGASFLTVFVLFVTRKIKRSIAIVLTWFIFSLMGALFSGRDWNHYFVQVFPSASILIALIVLLAKRFVLSKRFAIKLAGLAVLATLVCATGLFITNMTTHSPYHYYENFFLLVTGKRSRTDYNWHVNWEVPTQYRVVEYLNNHLQPDETFFNYSNHAWVYALTHRYPPTKYVVMYHLTAIPGARDELMDKLLASPPKYIVMFEDKDDFDELFEFVTEKYTLEFETDHAEIYRHLDS